MIASRGNRVLIADDDPQMLGSLSDVLRVEGYHVSTAASGAEAIEVMQREPIQLLITDLQMPQMDGLALTRKVQKEWPNTPVMILTAHGTIESAVESMQKGAVDFLVKPVKPDELLVRLSRRLEESSQKTQLFRLLAEVRKNGCYGQIIGANQKMREIFSIIERVGTIPSPVLIEGEPGTGKELIARAIHQRHLEQRVKQDDLSDAEREHMTKMAEVNAPYVAVNCGAFARSLLESQLFGFKKGTFTGAIADQEGVFVAARQGTLFLDEISELDFDLQVRLLRAIQEKEVTPLGSNHPIPISARIISATNQDISRRVEENKFRADLFYRINVVNIKVPPLRERVDDIPLLVHYFLRSTCENYGVRPREVEQPVMEVFQSYKWPGNVRELQNVIERAFALGQDDSKITLDDLPRELLQICEGHEPKDGDHVFPTLDNIMREHIVRALQVTNGNKSRASVLLGIDRNRLYRLIRKYSIDYDRDA